jgi:cytochrome P450
VTCSRCCSRRDEDGRPLTDAEIGDEVATFLLAGQRRPASVGTV